MNKTRQRLQEGILTGPNEYSFVLPNYAWVSCHIMPAHAAGTDWESERRDKTIIRECGEYTLIRNGPLEWETPPRVGRWPRKVWEPKRSPTAVDYLIAGKCMVATLAKGAQGGNAGSAWALARLAQLATHELGHIGRDRPELLRTCARNEDAWPVMKSKRNALSDEEKELFSKIELGADAILELDPATAKWKMDSAGRIAYSLLRYVEHARKVATIAKSLEPFSDDTAPAWWNAAELALFDSYPRATLHNVPELNAIVTSKSKRKSPGRIRQAILETLKSRFLSFAPNPF